MSWGWGSWPVTVKEKLLERRKTPEGDSEGGGRNGCEGEKASRLEGLGGQPSPLEDAENLAFVLASVSNRATLPGFLTAASEPPTSMRDSENAWVCVTWVRGGTQGSQEHAALS